jgi:hypothetical protein
LPQWADVDGDGQAELLLLRPKVPVPVPGKGFDPGEVTELLLSAVSLSTRRPIWETAIRPALTDIREFKQSTPERPAVYWVADLDQDGKPEVIVPVGRHGGFWTWDAATNSLFAQSYWICQNCWSGVELLDGATGNRRWQCPLWDTGADHPPIIGSVVAGPDLDGDGSRELFVTAVGHDAATDKEWLSVVAISAAEGRVLWRWQQAGRHDVRPPRWWQAGPDGWPQLVVPAESGPGGQPVTYILSAATGRVTHVLSEACVREVADFNGDGIADLFYWKFLNAIYQYGFGAAKLAVIPGALPEPWRRFGTWTAAQDFDGDGFTDLLALGDADLAARSGRDGHRLWQPQKTGAVSPSNLRQAFISPPVPDGGLDGDGHPDIVRFDEVRKVDPDGRSRGSYPTVSAFSGKDGHRLWTAPDFGMNSTGSSGSGGGGRLKWAYPMLDWCDLDGQGRPDVLVAYYPADLKGRTTHLAALSGRDGTLRWTVPFVQGTFAGLHGPPRGTVLKDLNGDGVLDLVLWVPKGDAHCEVRALSGRDGSELWPAASAVVRTSDGDYAPPPVVGDLDGDGIPEVVVVKDVREAGPSQDHWEVLALDGRDGRRKWTWRGPGSLLSWCRPLPLLLVDFHGDGRRSVCLGLYDNDAPQIVILNAEGRVANRIPLDLSWLHIHPGLDLINPWWTHADLLGDGKEELLFASGGHLCASRDSPQESLWKWPIPAPGEHTLYVTGRGEIVRLQPAAKDQVATVVVWVGASVYGLAGPTGLPRWRCDVPWPQPEYYGSPPTVQLLAADDLAGLPRILCRLPQHPLDSLSTVVRQAWPTGPDGRYQAPTPAAMSYEPEPVLIPAGQPLPWAPGALGRGTTTPVRDLMFYWLVFSGGYALIIVVFPGLLVYRVVRQRSWGAWLLLTAYASVTLVPYVYVAIRHYLWYQLQGVQPPIGWTFLFDDPTGWSAAYYVGKVVMAPILGTIAALPGAAFFVALVSLSVRRRWTRAGLLVALSIVACVALAAVLLWEDPRRMDAADEYSWKGWYRIGLLGAYATGMLLLVWIVLKAGFRLVRRAAGRLCERFKPA